MVHNTRGSIVLHLMDVMKNRRILLATLTLILFVYLCVKIRETSSDPQSPELEELSGDESKNGGDGDDVMQKIALLKREIGKLRRLASSCVVLGNNVFEPDLPVIYGITPTYTRPVQKAELTRLSQTLLLVPNFHWIIVEDSDKKTPLVANLLAKSGLSYTHLIAATPPDWKRKEKEPNWVKPRGVLQRNAALQWLRDNKSVDDRGVVYFSDDDNVYSLEIFEEMRWTKKVSVWPVGLVGGLLVEKPLIDKSGKVVGFNSAWHPERPFPIDMAGFAINLSHLLKHPEAKFSLTVQRGYQESAILKSLTTRSELEVKANNCSKVYVWHTRTENPNLQQEVLYRKKGQRSDLKIEV